MKVSLRGIRYNNTTDGRPFVGDVTNTNKKRSWGLPMRSTDKWETTMFLLGLVDGVTLGVTGIVDELWAGTNVPERTFTRNVNPVTDSITLTDNIMPIFPQ